MKLIFENSIGRVTFTGDSSGTFRLTELSGLTFPETAAETVRYRGEPGQLVTDISVLPRTITAAGDIKDKSGKHVLYAIRVLSANGTLTVVTPWAKRKIACRCTSFLPGKRQGTFTPFTLQLICDYPYFEDLTESCIAVAKRTGLLRSPFTLPAVFSRRSNEALVVNRGSVPTMPVIELTAAEKAACPNGIRLENRTTGAYLILACGIEAGETITVNCKERTISGTVQGNLLGSLASNTLMSAFSLEPGINELAVIVTDEPAAVAACCRFCNQYGEAIG